MRNKKKDKYLYMTNPQGKEEAFRIWDLIEYNGKEFLVLRPKRKRELLILEYEGEIEGAQESYISVDDEDTLNAVFALFKNRLWRIVLGINPDGKKK